MPVILQSISPIDNKPIITRQVADDAKILQAIKDAKKAQLTWQATPIQRRAEICRKTIDYFVQHRKMISKEITQQIGRPIIYSAGEINGLVERAHYMIGIAEQALKDIVIEESEDLDRFIRATPLGTVFVIAPWNYPYLTAVNSIIPALMAGNCVILKHAQQTMLCAERFAEAFANAELPKHVFQYLHLDHAGAQTILRHKDIHFISFTGSVAAGKKIESICSGTFKSLALELGGKDAAYVRADADIQFSVENLVDGTFFNSGQSCCGVERIYVDQKIYAEFLQKFVALVKKYKLGDPQDPQTTLGPMINQQAVQLTQQQIDQAKQLGAIAEIDESHFKFLNQPNCNSNYFAPQVMSNVTHQMELMREENFAPLVGIMSVSGDQQAIEFINDSDYGLTASIWSQDEDAAINLGNLINTGTVFLNRCDYLDPALPWSGIKNSGRGCALSQLGYRQLTRPKSFYLRKQVTSC